MKVTNLHQIDCSDDTVDSHGVSQIEDENRFVKNGFIVLHQSGLEKRLSTDVLSITRLESSSRNGYVVSHKHHKLLQGDNNCSHVKNSVPLSCDMVTEPKRVSLRSNSSDKNVAICMGRRLSQEKCQPSQESASIAAHHSSDKPRICVNGQQQCKSASASSLSSSSLSVQCKWNKCGCEIASDNLLEHIHIKHVAPQLRYSGDDDNAEEQSFVCLWNGCKVYNRPSCLLTWLERHIVSHLGDKPYCCIVAGCGARFASQVMLERHVNAHFSGNCSTSLAFSRSLRKADSVCKLTRKRKPRTARPYPGQS